MSSSYTDYLDEVRHQQQFNYGAIAIYTITLIASFVMCIIALVKLRVFKDLARKFIRWNLAAFVFYTIYMGLCVLAVALSIAWRQLLLSRRFSSPNRVLGLATSYVSFVAAAAGNLTDIMVVLTLVNLGFGIISMREARTTDAVAPGSKRGGIHNARFGAYGFGAVVGCLHVAVFALRCHIEADVSKGSSNSDLYLTLGTQVNRLAFAVGFLLLLAASCMVCWSIMTVITAKKHAQQSRTPAVYFLVCSSLFFLARLYVIADYAAHTSLQSAALSTPYEGYTAILDPILGSWPIFVVFILLFVLGRKQREQGGLWMMPQLPPPGMQVQAQFYAYPPPQQQQQTMYVNNGYAPSYGVSTQAVKPYPHHAIYPAMAPAPQQLGPNLSPIPQQLGPNLPPMLHYSAFHQQQPQQQPISSPQHQQADDRVASPTLTTPSARSPVPQEVSDNRPANSA